MTSGLPVLLHHFCTWRRFLVSFLQTSATVTLDRVAAPLSYIERASDWRAQRRASRRKRSAPQSRACVLARSRRQAATKDPPRLVSQSHEPR
jgi:hypothetical protein